MVIDCCEPDTSGAHACVASHVMNFHHLWYKTFFRSQQDSRSLLFRFQGVNGKWEDEWFFYILCFSGFRGRNELMHFLSRSRLWSDGIWGFTSWIVFFTNTVSLSPFTAALKFWWCLLFSYSGNWILPQENITTELPEVFLLLSVSGSICMQTGCCGWWEDCGVSLQRTGELEEMNCKNLFAGGAT